MFSTPELLPQSAALIERGVADGLHSGGQLYVSRAGAVIADWATGDARPGVPMSTDTIVLWLSAVKPITAVALAQFWERGRVSLDDPVAKWVPEFAQQGKEPITIEHLLTHTAGFRSADKCDLGLAWEEIIDCICRAPVEPNWIPGQRAGYHTSSSWYMLGEIVRRVDGRTFEEYARANVLSRCGMLNSSLTLPPDEFQRLEDRLAFTYHTEKRMASPHHKWNSPADAAVCRPGRSGRGPIRELGLLYELLLRARKNEGAPSVTLGLQPETVLQLTKPRRVGLFDETFRHILDWGLGFCINSNRYGRETVPYGYGRFCGAESFGHGGAQSTCAFADPEHDLVVAWAFNGLPGDPAHQRRARELNSAIYQDLQLA
jgi:CubicO group peptidase (beta-lactamase class C family)